MERTKINLFGASGHAKVIIDVIHSHGGEIHEIFDDNTSVLEVSGYNVSHTLSNSLLKDAPTIIAIGNNKIRKEIANSFSGKFGNFLSHKSAIISPSAKIGKGTVVMANACINAAAVVGRHCIINTASVVEHEVEIKDFAHISPNASIAGNVKIGEGTHVGIGASVIPNVSIGNWVVIGAGAVIIEDIPDFATVVGNPGRILKNNGNYEKY